MAQAFYTGGYKSPVRQNLLEDWNKALKRLHGWLYLVLKQAAKDLDLRFKAQCLSAASREPWKTQIFFLSCSRCVLGDTTSYNFDHLAAQAVLVPGSPPAVGGRKWSPWISCPHCLGSLQHQAYLRTQNKVSWFFTQHKSIKWKVWKATEQQGHFF